MESILNREGAAPWLSGVFFKAVVKVVLLFRSDTWVVTPPHGQGPGGISGPGGDTADGTAPV